MREFDDLYNSIVETNSYSMETIPSIATYQRRRRTRRFMDEVTYPVSGSMAEMYLESDGMVDEEFDYWPVIVGIRGENDGEY